MKSLFLPFSPSLAHVTRCLSAAEAWRSAGNEAIFAVGRERMELVSGSHFDVHEVPEIPTARFQSDRGFSWLTKEYITENVERERAIGEAIRPDVIVFDFRFSSKITARITGVPSVGIIHGNAAMLADAPAKAGRAIFESSEKEKTAFNPRMAIISTLFPVAFQLIMRIVSRKLNGCLKNYGMQTVASPFEMLFGDRTIVADIPELIPVPLRPSARVVGPLLWAGWSRPEPVLSTLGNAPLIYVTMGSTIKSSKLMGRLIECLADLPFNAIVSTGGVELGLASVPANVRVVPYISGQTVMARSALVIHHGGHETLMQALAAGVPSLALPVNPDQIILSKQITKCKFGRCVRKPGAMPMDENPFDWLSNADIRGIIEETIRDESIRKACMQAQKSISSFQPAAVVDLIKNAAIK